MSISKEDAALAVQVLKSAKDYLWSGQGEYPRSDSTDSTTPYVCYAINRAANRWGNAAAYGVAQDIKVLILERLVTKNNRHGNVKLWLEDPYGGRVRSGITHPRLQDYRRRWIDSLIAEYRKAAT